MNHNDELGMIPKPDRTTYTVLDFVGWHEAGTLELTPKFQRRGVWTTPARSFFIDTLIRGLPVPPIYLRTTQSSDRKRIVREVVDGQQRISAVLDYMADKYPLARSLDAPWAGRRFKQLSEQQQDAIRQFGFICEVLLGVSDAQILEIFTRLNTYSVQLNRQELLNGRYFGLFKQSCYRLAHEQLEFWRRHRVFSDRSIARMLEVELTSELLIVQLDGLQDKKKSIAEFYQEYDDKFPNQHTTEAHFRRNIDAIEESVGDLLSETEFRRVPLFYSLYCTIHHRQFGLPKSQLETPKRPLTDNDRQTLRAAVESLSEAVELARDGQDVARRYAHFVSACLRQTDNLQPRRTRLEFIYRTAF